MAVASGRRFYPSVFMLLLCFLGYYLLVGSFAHCFHGCEGAPWHVRHSEIAFGLVCIPFLVFFLYWLKTQDEAKNEIDSNAA